MADCQVLVQFCWSHLIRDIRFVAEQLDRSLRIWGQKLLSWIAKLFTTCK